MRVIGYCNGNVSDIDVETQMGMISSLCENEKIEFFIDSDSSTDSFGKVLELMEHQEISLIVTDLSCLPCKVNEMFKNFASCVDNGGSWYAIKKDEKVKLCPRDILQYMHDCDVAERAKTGVGIVNGRDILSFGVIL